MRLVVEPKTATSALRCTDFRDNMCPFPFWLYVIAAPFFARVYGKTLTPIMYTSVERFTLTSPRQ